MYTELQPSVVTYETVPGDIPFFGASQVRKTILTEFFTHPGLAVHVRELGRRLHIAPAVVGRELERLERSGILRSETIGRSRRYSVDEGSEIAQQARSLFNAALGRDLPAASERQATRGE